jgi:hypothetical protein
VKITFDLQSPLPEELAQEFASPELGMLLGRIRTVGERLQTTCADAESALWVLRDLLTNDLVRGIQMTVEKDKDPHE